jgi:2-hydroxychromene-2-carboxylate isomerase
MATEVEFFFSPASRYSYLAATQIRALERDTGCNVVWRPVHGPDIRALRGHDPFQGPAISGQYDLAYRKTDAEAWAAYYGVPFVEPREFYFEHRLFARAAAAGVILGAGTDFQLALTAAIYARGRWPLDEAFLLEFVGERRLDPGTLRAALDSPEVAALLESNAREAFERGAFGVPTFFVGSHMYWGNDRIVLVRHELMASGVPRA